MEAEVDAEELEYGKRRLSKLASCSRASATSRIHHILDGRVFYLPLLPRMKF